ncbi:MAG: hypothetical protein M9891_11290, partial [Austwickia sp.]|nr:hypothetical protein [Austwickia sp.]
AAASDHLDDGQAYGKPASLAGRLEVPDRGGHFRLVDDVGNRSELAELDDPAAAAELANQRVLAEGQFTPSTPATKATLESVALRPYEHPDHVLAVLQPTPPVLPVGPVEHARMPDGIALTETELDAFLATIHE